MATNGAVLTESQCKIHCLKLKAEDVLRALVLCLSAKSKEKSLAAVLNNHKAKLKTLRSMKYSGNKDKIFQRGKTIRSDVDVNEFDLTLLIDLLLNIPALSSCISLDLNLSEILKVLREMRNNGAHGVSKLYRDVEEKMSHLPLPSDCLEWKRNIEKYEKGLKDLLKFLKMHDCINETEYRIHFSAIEMVLLNRKEKYWPIFEERSELKISLPKLCADRRLEVTYEADKVLNSEGKWNLNSPRCNRLAEEFESAAIGLLHEQLGLQFDSNVFQIDLTTNKYFKKDELVTAKYSIHITSEVEELPDAFKKSHSPESCKLREELTENFQKLFCHKYVNNPEDVKIECSGWDYRSIHIYFNVYTQQDHQMSLDYQTISQNLKASVVSVLNNHGLSDCPVSIQLEDNCEKEKQGLLLGFLISFKDETYLKKYDQIAGSLPEQYVKIISKMHQPTGKLNLQPKLEEDEWNENLQFCLSY
ncbi:uncharacterized protein LOC130628935 [Hydractinia symbiolongicarpus]|uniref:uncharacterized protein LOC130628935 n=1 Tax=Hydractinia symbiolongicarpus TaxID=13093 RepID=UPI00254A2A13|nr:uncharacterized protein LOC130628935 [Hydractinia symbiolongicarpus]